MLELGDLLVWAMIEKAIFCLFSHALISLCDSHLILVLLRLGFNQIFTSNPPKGLPAWVHLSRSHVSVFFFYVPSSFCKFELIWMLRKPILSHFPPWIDPGALLPWAYVLKSHKFVFWNDVLDLETTPTLAHVLKSHNYIVLKHVFFSWGNFELVLKS